MAVDLIFILAVEAVLPSGAGDVGAGDREKESGGETFEKIAEGVAGEIGLEGELAEIVGGQESFDVGVADAADVHAGFESMFAAAIAEVVGELGGFGLSDTGFVSADGSEAGAGGEVEGGKGGGVWMLADVDAGEAELLKRGGALNGKADAGDDVGEAEAEFVYDVIGDGVGVRNEKTAIVDAVGIIGEQRIGVIGGDVLAAETGVGRLFGRDGLVDADVGSVGVGGSGLEI